MTKFIKIWQKIEHNRTLNQNKDQIEQKQRKYGPNEYLSLKRTYIDIKSNSFLKKILYNIWWKTFKTKTLLGWVIIIMEKVIIDSQGTTLFI